MNAIAERLGNFIDPMNLPEELVALRHDFLMCATKLGLKKATAYKTYKQKYDEFCRGNHRENGCKVQNMFLNYA